MSNSKYSKFLTILLVIATIAVIVLLAYFIYDIYRKNNYNKKAEDAVDAFQEQFANNDFTNYTDNNEIEDSEGNISGSDDENSNSLNDENGSDNNGNNNSGSTGNSNTNNGSSYTYTTNYEGYTMIGTIQIPKINLKSPILQEISPEALQKATCLIYGKINQKENAVIIGHNNRNGTFFSNLKKLSAGDEITITDSTGNTVVYVVYSIFETTPDETSFYQRDTYGLSEITLSTCTDSDDTKRTIVLARES